MRLLATATASLVVLAPQVASAKVDYVRQIKPILEAKCAECHQPARVVDGRKYKPRAGVVLNSPEGIAEAAVIDWGRPDHSLLVQRIILAPDHEDVMPPAKFNKPVTKDEVDLIKLWITETGGGGSGNDTPGAKPTEQVGFSNVKAILSSKCYECHKDPGSSGKKPKGGLILDTVAGIRASGSVKPGKPEASELLIRMELPQNDEDVMPPKKTNKKMTESELATVRNWILGGAPFGDGGTTPVVVKTMTASEVLAQGVKEAPAAAVQRLTDLGATITPISASSPFVTVEFISGYQNIGDDFVKQLFLIAPNIAELDLSRTKITDASLEYIGAFARLTKLNLASTGVGDAGMAKLTGLKQLDWLNLYATQVSDAGLPEIAKIRGLKTMYVYKSKVTADGLEKLKKAFPKTKIVGDLNTGGKNRFDIE